MILHKIKYKYTRAFSNCYVIKTFGSNNKLIKLLLILYDHNMYEKVHILVIF